MLGTGFIINRNLKVAIVEFKSISERMCRVRNKDGKLIGREDEIVR